MSTPGRGGRILDVVAGLFSAGTLVVGVLLLVMALAAPTVLERAGLGEADGPGWSRVLAQLLVGAAGELVVRVRPRWPDGLRAAADLAVIAGCLTVIWWVWWR